MVGIACKATATENQYDLLIKPIKDDDGRIKSGVVLKETTPQNQAMILTAHIGEYKHAPLLGVGLPDVVHDNEFDYWKRRIAEHLKRDGQKITQLELQYNKLTLEAEYK